MSCYNSLSFVWIFPLINPTNLLHAALASFNNSARSQLIYSPKYFILLTTLMSEISYTSFSSLLSVRMTVLVVWRAKPLPLSSIIALISILASASSSAVRRMSSAKAFNLPYSIAYLSIGWSIRILSSAIANKFGESILPWQTPLFATTFSSPSRYSEDSKSFTISLTRCTSSAFFALSIRTLNNYALLIES